MVGSMFARIAAWFKTVLAVFGMGEDPLDKEVEDARVAFKAAMDTDKVSDATGPE